VPTIYCYNPATGQYTAVQTSSVFSGGSSQPSNPNFMARKINLSIMDVSQTIAEGRQIGIVPFNLFGSPNDTQRGALR
jgi:hypothetical protein